MIYNWVEYKLKWIERLNDYSFITKYLKSEVTCEKPMNLAHDMI